VPKITCIESQKKRRGRVNIYLDDEFAFGLDEKMIIDHNLYKGLELCPLDIKALKESDNLSKAMEKAYRLLSFRQRSKQEITDRLLEKFDERTTQKALEKLERYGYINDTEFARVWVSSRAAGRGKKALAFELKRKGVSKDIIEDSLANLSGDQEEDAAYKIVTAKSKYLGLDNKELYKKVAPFLASRGFSYETIKKVIDKLKK
jgi:regulatory protein